MRMMGPRRKRGAMCTIADVVRSENKEDINRVIKNYVKPGSTIRTDELPGYKHLVGEGDIYETVNHSIEFSNDDGSTRIRRRAIFRGYGAPSLANSIAQRPSTCWTMHRRRSGVRMYAARTLSHNCVRWSGWRLLLACQLAGLTMAGVVSDARRFSCSPRAVVNGVHGLVTYPAPHTGYSNQCGIGLSLKALNLATLFQGVADVAWAVLGLSTHWFGITR